MINMISAIKLGATNYLPCRCQIMHMAECFNLMGLLDGSVVAPSPTVTSDVGAQSVNPAYTAWKMKDKKLLSVIYTSLYEDAAFEVIDSSTLRDTWLTLEGIYSSASRQHQLRRNSYHFTKVSRPSKNVVRNLSFFVINCLLLAVQLKSPTKVTSFCVDWVFNLLLLLTLSWPFLIYMLIVICSTMPSNTTLCSMLWRARLLRPHSRLIAGISRIENSQN